MEQYQQAINQMIQGVRLLLSSDLEKKTTKIYSGLVLSVNSNNTWNVQYNGEIHSIPSYGSIQPAANMMVKVVVPQGNQNLAFFF